MEGDRGRPDDTPGSAQAAGGDLATRTSVSPLPQRTGCRLGPYQVLSQLGAGGMGEVYRARDTTLGRDVAIKFLPAALLHDPERLARFDREARLLASLNHPNIATVYGFEQGDPAPDSPVSGRALVMELVEGDTLAERIARGSTIPLQDVLAVATQVARGLEAAHGKGVVHRDLKPANIMVRPDGTVKVLDFGLAKATAPAGAGPDAGEASTVTLDGTRLGVILGTAPYMSPEQARGHPVDFRTDVWSFGCLLFEMLTGRAPFARGTLTDTLAAVLEREPDWTALPATTPPALAALLRRCLEKDAALRLPQIRDVRLALDEIVADSGHRGALKIAVSADGRTRRLTQSAAFRLGAAAVLLLALGTSVWMRSGWGSGPSAPTLAVLPFANASTDPEHAYLAEGLADALIRELIEIPAVRVVSPGSALRYASASSMTGGMSFMSDMPQPADGMGMGARKPLDEIARELGAGLLLEGTVDRENDRIVVTASLVQADPLKSLWRRTFSRPASEMLSLQRDLAAAVMAAIPGGGGSGGGDSKAVRRQYDPAAHDAYLKGAYYQAHWKLPQAVESFARAVEIDPSHSAAHAGLARAYYFLAFFGDLSPSIALAGMRRAATTALEHDPSMADAHAQLALVKMLQDWDWEGAERSFRVALEISPANAQIRHDYAHFLLGQGRRRESMEHARQAVALDPVNPMLISCLGWHSLFDARFEEAARLATEATSLMPDHWAEVVHGWALLGRGQTSSALEHMRAAVRLRESPFTLAALAHALAIAGREDESRRTLASLVTRAEREYVSAYDISTVYAGLGEADAAFKWLRRAAEERSMFIVHVGWDFRMDPIRGDQRLADLTAREMRLPTPRFALLNAHERRGM